MEKFFIFIWKTWKSQGISKLIFCDNPGLFFVSLMTRTLKEAIDHANARSIRGYAIAACVVLSRRDSYQI